MPEITVRFRSAQGQYNQKIGAEERMTTLLGLVAAHYGMPPTRVAARLFHDVGHERRLIASDFKLDTPVSRFITTNGQIVYVSADAPDADRPRGAAPPGTTMEELEAAMAHPRELAPGCAHPQAVHCTRCLQAWEQKVLRAAGVSQLEWDQYRLRKQAAAPGHAQTIKDIRRQTLTQVVLRYQGDFRCKTLHIDTTALTALQQHLIRRNYGEEFMFFIYGTGDCIQLFDPVFYVTMFGSQVTPEKSWQYQQMKRDIIEQNFGLQLMGCGFCTKNQQFSKTQMLQALQCGGDLMLHVQLIDVNNYSTLRHQEGLRRKFEEVGMRTVNVTLTIGERQRPNGYQLEAYGLNDQIQFLYKNGVVDEAQDNPSQYELKFRQKQIINEQFMDCIDTDCFLVNIGVIQGTYRPASRVRSIVPWQDVFERLNATTHDDAALVAMITTHSGAVMRDPNFLLLMQLAGVHVAGKDAVAARDAVAQWLRG